MRVLPAEPREDQRLVVLVASAAVAAAFFVALFVIAIGLPRRTVSVRAAPVRLRIVEVAPRPREVSPPPPPVPRERERHRAARRAPRPADPTPLNPEPRPADPPAEAPVPLIAGLTLSSTTAAGRGPRFGVGNTQLGTPGARAGDPDASSSSSAPLVVGAARVEARLLEGAAPDYSSEARREGVEGVVVLALTLDASGHVEQARVIRGLGYGLDEAALRAARETRWAAATLDGAPVRSFRRFTVRFTLRS